MNRLKYMVRLSMLLMLMFIAIGQSHATSSSAGNAQITAGASGLDEKLAAYYEIYASVEPFESRIAQAAAANAGQRPVQIQIVKSLETGFQQHVHSGTLPANAAPHMESEVANSDLIVIGTPVSSRSFPIQDRTFLFTEYSVNVEKVISPGKTNVTPGQTIVVSRGGGEMIVDGVLVKAIEPAFDQLRLNQPYIFMLRAVPNTDAFRALGSGTFSVENGTVIPASHLASGASTQKNKDLNSFLTELDGAVARKRSGRN